MSTRILFCRVSYMKYYKGITKEDRPIGGGKWVEINGDAGEKFNFLPDGNILRGFVQTDENEQVHIERIDEEYKNADSIDNVIVVFCSNPPNSEMKMIIVGWYKDATVYRYLKKGVYFGRENFYRIIAESKNAYLIPETERGNRRDLEVPTRKGGFGESFVWYADQNPEYVKLVLEYINETEKRNQQAIENELKALELANSNFELNETERIILSKARIAQGKFRDSLIERDGCCRICQLRNQKLLVASHIKPWAKSTNAEKLDSENGLLLCAMHDALFDKGLISFDQDGRLMISVRLSEDDRAKVMLSQSFILEMSNKMKQYMKYHLDTWKSESIYVHHTKYGDGIITDTINGDRDYEIRFDKDYVEGGSMKPTTIPCDSPNLELVF